MAVLDKLEFIRFGPYRFIGKSVYARVGAPFTGEIFGSLWGNSAGIFARLDELNAYASPEVHQVALLTGDRYDEEKKLIGYTVGRFMKAGTPVPEGLDFFDIPATTVAKGWVSGEFNDMISSAEGLTLKAIEAQTEYTPSWSVLAEVYTEDTVPQAGVHSVLGYYIGCNKAK